MKHIMAILVEFAAAMVLLVGVYIYHTYAEKLTRPQLLLVAPLTIVLCLLTIGAAAWVWSRPRDIVRDLRNTISSFERDRDVFNAELKAALRDFLHNQPVVSEEVLALIEKDAHDIWVVTTDLKNDVNPGKIRDSVENNLISGKSYTYFIPSPKNPNFPEAAQNEQGYKRWSIYEAHRSQIRFIHLPDDTLFLFREVVVYNPIVDPNIAHEKAIPIGFTYFDVTAGARDRLMRVPPEYLSFLIGQLNRYRADIGLKTELERLIEDLKPLLDQQERLYLFDLFGSRLIEDRAGHRNFIEKIRQRDSALALTLEKSLSPYLETGS